MSNYDILAGNLGAVLQVLRPVQKDWETRLQIINDLRDAVASIESLRGAIVEPFGSFVSNLFTQWGDLDISIEQPNGLYMSSAAKKHKQRLLQDVQRALRKTGRWYRLQYVPRARIPLLKSISSRQGISCDISIDNLQGIMKSRLLYWISDIDGRFRDMVLLVKEWAKAHDINNSKAGTLNSYSLSLLVIFHFQTCEPAILPPLRNIYPGNMVGALQGLRDDAMRSIADTCAAGIARWRSDKSRRVNRSSLSELFISFFAKFSNLTSRASQLGICPYTGQWEDIESNTRWLPKTYAIFIEDPFEQPENTARSVNACHLEKIAEAFQRTHYNLNLRLPHQSQNAILATITTETVSEIVARARANHPSQYGVARTRTPTDAHGYNGVNIGFNGAARPRTPMVTHGYNGVNIGQNGAARTRTPAFRHPRSTVGEASSIIRNYNCTARTPVSNSSTMSNEAQNPRFREPKPQIVKRPGQSSTLPSQVRSNGNERQQFWRPKPR